MTIASAGRVARKRDVSEYFGAGWSKGADGYVYDIPTKNLDTVEETFGYEPGCANGGYGSYCCINGAENPDCILSSEEPRAPIYTPPASIPIYSEPTYTAGGDYEVTNEYFAPNDDSALPSNEYLPPALRRLRLQKRRLRVAKRQ